MLNTDVINGKGNVLENETFNRNRKRLLYLFIAVFYAIIFVRDLGYANISFNVISVYSAIVALFLDRKGRFLYLFALLPFCRGIPYSEITLISFFIDLVLNIWAIKVSYKLYLPIIIITLVDVVDELIFNVLSVEIFYLLMDLIYVAYACNEKLYKDVEKKLVYLFSISTFIAVVFVFLREMKFYGFDYIVTYSLRFGEAENGIIATNFNSNELGLYCAVAVASLLSVGNGKYKVACVVFALCCTGVGMISISRTFLLVVAGIWFLYLLLSKHKIKALFFLFIALVVVILIIMFFFSDVYNWIVDYYIVREGETKSSNYGNRFSLIIDYLNCSVSNLWGFLFGFSWQYKAVLSKVEACHNGTQELLVSWGMVGFCIFIYWIVNIFKSITGKRKIKLIYFLPLIAFVVYIQALQLITMHVYLLLFFISFVAINVEGANKYGKK